MARTMKKAPMQTTLNQMFRFDLNTGYLYWRESPSNNVNPGDRAGSLNKSTGYIRVGIDGVRYYVHRLIYKMVYGTEPDQIDHINHNRSDNSLENIRSVKHSINHKNKSKRADNTFGCQGVCWDKGNGKWRAGIQVDGKQKYIGLFSELVDAVCARKSAENEYGFHENHGG